MLAEALAPTHRVISVDMPGRGASEWLADPNDYMFPDYLDALTALIARSGAETVGWVGTSMGGLLGMVMAAQPESPVARLVVNDVGPTIEARCAGAHPRLFRHSTRRSRRTMKSRSTCARSPRRSARSPMRNGSTSPHQRPAACRRPLGPRLRPGHRGAVPQPRRRRPTCGRSGIAIRCPTLVLRGAQSDLLSRGDRGGDGGSRGPRPRVVGIRGRRPRADAAVARTRSSP